MQANSTRSNRRRYLSRKDSGHSLEPRGCDAAAPGIRCDKHLFIFNPVFLVSTVTFCQIRHGGIVGESRCVSCLLRLFCVVSFGVNPGAIAELHGHIRFGFGDSRLRRMPRI
jgi:hypothetical protein